MSVVVEITNQSKLEKAKDLLGAKTESETIEIALDITIEKFKSKKKNSNDLPEDYFEDIFAEETNLSDGKSVQAVINEREDSPEKAEEAEEYFDIDVHELKRIPPKKSFKVTANFKISGRRKPMKYDFSDFVEDAGEE